jgi:SET domain-containing protein
MSEIKKVVVKRSSAGLGLFAAAPFNKGELVIEYIGEVVSDAEAQRRGGKYLFELNDNWTIDGKGRQNIARYINHSCKPNCEPQLSDDEKQVFIYTKRKISPGEELTYNYGTDYFKRVIKPSGCRCVKCKTTA